MPMSLDNLVGVTLEKIEPDATVIKRLLSSAHRNIADAHVMETTLKIDSMPLTRQSCSYPMLLYRQMVSEH
jgi:hypothetical protein